MLLLNLPYLLIVWVYRFRDLIAISNYNFMENPNQKDVLGIRKKLLVITDFCEAYHNSILNISLAFLGMNFDNFFFLVQLFINFFLFRPIRYLNAAFWINGLKFIVLMLFMVFSLIPVSYVVQQSYTKQFIIDDGSIEPCRTLYSCWNYVLNLSLRSYGGISDYMTILNSQTQES